MQEDGEWGFRSAHTSFSLELLLPFRRVNPPQATVLQDEPSAVWAPLCRPVFPQGVFTCSDVGSSTGCREIPVPLWPTQLATGKSAPAPGAPPPTPSAQTLGFAGLLLTHVLPQSSLPVRYLIFSSMCFLRNATSLTDRISFALGGRVWSMLDVAGPSHVWHGAAPSFSGHLLHVPHCQNLHTYIQCKQYTKNI